MYKELWLEDIDTVDLRDCKKVKHVLVRLLRGVRG